MARCTKKSGLEVHHKRRTGGNGMDNAQVLCANCHEETTTYGQPGNSPPAFSEQTKKEALKRAGNQCECTSNRGCH